MNKFDVTINSAKVEFLPTLLRLPLKFGAETISSLTALRVKIEIKNIDGEVFCGWGETPLSAAWSWPSAELSYTYREEAMKDYCLELSKAWEKVTSCGHPMELGYEFLEKHMVTSELPHLAQLICNSAFDLALHDAYGRANNCITFNTYNSKYMNKDLSFYFEDDSYKGKYPADYFVSKLPDELVVWHLVGGKDLLDDSELTGNEIQDNYPVTLTQWIKRDKLKCLKVKLTGSDKEWDYKRMVDIGKIALEYNISYLSPDFNCLVKDVDYVNEILDKLMVEEPAIYGMILYVEQPFPYDLMANQINVKSVSARKPLFMDESAHDWRYVKKGFELGWSAVALKVCKTQTGALLSACWAKENGMLLMVQDLTNPMLAVIPHVQLARYVGTIMGVECNAPQFYPEISKEYALRHEGLYDRKNGVVNLKSLSNIGLGYSNEDIEK